MLQKYLVKFVSLHIQCADLFHSMKYIVIISVLVLAGRGFPLLCNNSFGTSKYRSFVVCAVMANFLELCSLILILDPIAVCLLFPVHCWLVEECLSNFFFFFKQLHEMVYILYSGLCSVQEKWEPGALRARSSSFQRASPNPECNMQLLPGSSRLYH